MSSRDMEMVSRAFTQATGQPLRSTLLSVMPEDREAYIHEISVAAEVDERAERMRQFAASFFVGGTNIEDGLVINGQRAGGELPPRVFDADFNRYKVEQEIRREDAARAANRPPDQSADQIRASFFAPDGRDISAGLTDAKGRPTSFEKISEADPNSALNQARRQRQARISEISTMTGARRV
jgi:hypothetical protein